jgi:hypothetical protein
MTLETEKLCERLAELERRLASIEDREAIERLQAMYGYYIDNRLWDELTDLFCDERPAIEIGRRGRYVGKERIRHFLHHCLGGDRAGLHRDEFINHVQLQMVTTLAPDGLSARMRARAVVQGNSPPGGGAVLWAEGVYENEYVREGGRWKIRSVWWAPTFYAQLTLSAPLVFDSAPADDSFPPDAPSQEPDPLLGRIFVPYHYAHPMTGEPTGSPGRRR